jgi:hypothetical protein
MHKTNSATHLKMVLSDVLNGSFQHMTALARELKELDITPENIKEKTDHQLMIHQTISNLLTIINDIIHPAHDMLEQLFDTKIKDFADFCKKNQALAIEKKLINPKCKCYSCRGKEYGKQETV